MKKKKIIIVYQYFGTKESKWSTRWFDFSKHFINQGYEVTVITSNFIRSDIKKSIFFKSMMIDNVKVKLFPFGDGNNFSVLRRVVNSFFFLLSTLIYLMFFRADKYIFSSGPITAALPLIFKSKRNTILEIRDLWPDGGFEMKKIPIILSKPLFFIQKKLYKSAGKIITCSPSQRKHILDNYPELHNKIHTVEHGIDYRIMEFSLLHNQNRSELKKKYWIVVGTFGFIHNPYKWIELAQNLIKLDSNINIVLIGSGPLFDDIKSKIYLNKINNIILTGQLSKEELSKWIAKSEFCLFTTLDNIIQQTSAPNKIYDYLVFKKPILIDLDMWLLKKYGEIIWKVDFTNFNKDDLVSIRHKKVNLNFNAIDCYINELDRNKLADKYLT
ncbi:glycosyltransferase family 4 protein [Bacteroidia bacterium]|nr:glycosyltransferase family 4 protein [Bacteroidia bacterium]